MSTDNPVITKAVVELTFANGLTRRYVLDDKDASVACSLDVTTDIHETTRDGGSFRTFGPGPRQRVALQLIGRGPHQSDLPLADSKRVYIAMIDDRHADTEAYPFSTAEQAIEYAKGWARGAARYEAAVEEEEVEGWLYYARYSSEGDSVWVIEKDLDLPAAVLSVPSETPGATNA